jgi:hypothetical protein
MFRYNGSFEIDVVMEINMRFRNPYDAIERVCIDSARPLKEVDRIIFIAENIKELDLLCEVYYNDWKKYGDNPPVPVKRATHPSTPTLH